jgi:hypothetical protein
MASAISPTISTGRQAAEHLRGGLNVVRRRFFQDRLVSRHIRGQRRAAGLDQFPVAVTGGELLFVAVQILPDRLRQRGQPPGRRGFRFRRSGEQVIAHGHARPLDGRADVAQQLDAGNGPVLHEFEARLRGSQPPQGVAADDDQRDERHRQGECDTRGNREPVHFYPSQEIRPHTVRNAQSAKSGRCAAHGKDRSLFP